MARSISLEKQTLSSLPDVPVPVIAAMTEFDIVDHPVKDTLMIVSSLLSLMVQKNDSQYNPLVDPVTLFHSRAVPRISIESYLARVLQFIPFTNEVLLNVLVYLDRIGGLGGMEMGSSGAVEGELLRKVVAVVPSILSNPTSAPPSSSSPTPSPQSPAIRSETVSCTATVPSKSSSSTTANSTACPFSPQSSQQPRSTSSTTPSPLNHASSCIASPSPSKISEDPESSIHCRGESTRPNLSSDFPMIHKRDREDENLEPTVVKSNLTEFSQHHREQANSQAQRGHEGESWHASKRTKLESVPSTSSIINVAAASSSYTQHQPTVLERARETVEVQNTPGGSTPAPTPKLAVASNGFRINSFNVHRLLITCIMVAAKFTSDHFYSNARYAKVGGLSLLELNQLELEFLFTTRFELNVKVEELQRVGDSLLRFKSRELIAPHQAREQQQRASYHGNAINTATVSDKDSQSLQQKKSRFSIPSPTSPRNGPMSDKAALTSSSLPSTSSPSSTISNIATTALTSTTATSIISASSTGATTVVTASDGRAQRPQLLSPPEEKHRWADNDDQVTEERIDQTQERNRPSSSSSTGG
ncbi:hypothetical protein BGX27_008378 [Mortierella sp. AM989]|nr:hypothetical protein BGX27_008378 [Mortierella sp. AM989]